LALADLGFAASKVEVHETAQPLYGYKGDRRPEKAEIIIRRKYVGHLSNDLGFAFSKETGAYEALISDYDRSREGYHQGWLAKLTQRHSYHLVMQQAELAGFTVVEQQTEQGEIRLVLAATSGMSTRGGF
jgi:hypothetical protein